MLSQITNDDDIEGLADMLEEYFLPALSTEQGLDRSLGMWRLRSDINEGFSFGTDDRQAVMILFEDSDWWSGRRFLMDRIWFIHPKLRGNLRLVRAFIHTALTIAALNESDLRLSTYGSRKPNRFMKLLGREKFYPLVHIMEYRHART